MNFVQHLRQKLGYWLIWLSLLALPACNLWPAPPEPQPEALLPTATVTLTLTALPSPSPTALPATPLPSPSPTVAILNNGTVEPAAETGTVTGRICYPGSRTPPMTLYLKPTAAGATLEQKIEPDQAGFTLTAPPGEYIAYAQTVGTGLTGLYSEAVTCGLGPDCTGHQPLPFSVNRQQTTTSIDLCDWYIPPGVVSAGSGQNASPVQVVTLQQVNLFAGPGLAYDKLGVIPALTLARASGRSLDGDWLQLDYPVEDSSTGWVFAPLVQLSAAPDTLPVLDASSSPPAPSPNQFIPAAWSAEANAGLMHLKGFIRDKAGQPVNGFSILADNGTWSVLSHPTGPSNWFPDQQNGEWDIVVTNVTDAVGWWSLTVVSYDCPDFEKGFDAQCKQFTRLSENQVIKIVYPDETVINADWICQRDCDKGLKLSSTN